MRNITRVTVGDVKKVKVKGPWPTKSGGALTVPIALTLSEVSQYLELGESPSLDIYGIRIYIIDDLSLGKVGGDEFHRVRKEYAFTLRGAVRWTCEDLKGNSVTIDAPAGTGIFIPPFILHTYEVTAQGTLLMVLANTLFSENYPDTENGKSFHSLRN